MASIAQSDAARAVKQLRAVLLPLVAFSFVTNLSVLVSPIFMMHVLNRVVPTGNLNTLAMLFLIAVGALLTTSVVEFFRDQTLGKSGDWLELTLSRTALSERLEPPAATTMGNVSRLREFIAGQGATLLLDAPWIPLFLLVLTLIHPAFVAFALTAACLLFGLSWVTKAVTEQTKTTVSAVRQDGSRTLSRVDHLGPSGGLMALYSNLRALYLASLDQIAKPANRLRRADNISAALGRFLRSFCQIGSLALGAYLVTQGSLSAGGMIGASIILGKTIAIIEAATRLVPQVKDVRAAYEALNTSANAPEVQRTEVADLSGALKAVNLTIPRGNGRPPRIDRISFKIKPGECVAIMGASGSGKSTLLEALSGISPAKIGNTFLDETDVRSLNDSVRHTAIGYVPQMVPEMSGTIASNLSRFDPNPDDAKILAASRLAGVHGLISALPNAYETDLGKEGYLLSAGQKQRLMFARALYETPKYLFMDEPNALLDHEGERNMLDAIHRLKSQGTTIVLSAHRLGIVHLCDRIIVMEDGKVVDMGQRSEVLGRMASAYRRLRLPISGGSIQDLSDWIARQFTREGDSEFRERATTVATELFAFGRDNGPDTSERMINFEFEFIDDVTCSIMMSEPRHLQIDAKVSKVQERVQMSLPNLDGLNRDERSLAAVMQIAEKCEHRAEEDLSAVLATIVHRPTQQLRVV